MNRALKIALIFFFTVFLLDQGIKYIFVNGFFWNCEVFTLSIHYNKGVAFSLLAFLDEYLKYIQIFFLFGLFFYFYTQKEFLKENAIAIGILFGAGSSNILDRFIHEGVVDYFYWHYWFDFAIFNFADVMINIAVILIIYKAFKNRKKRA